MRQAHTRLEIKLRLGEIDRRFAELTAISSKLAGMTAQLNRLREADEKMGRFADCSCGPGRRRKDDDPLKGPGKGRGHSRENIVDEH